MKILHTADWHLGKIFKNFSLIEDQKQVLEQVIHLVASQKPDVVIIAGDLYDKATPPAQAIQLLNDTLAKLIIELKIPVIAIAGNHDQAEKIDYCSTILQQQGLYIFGSLPEKIPQIVLRDAYGEVFFYPFPFLTPEEMQYWVDTHTVDKRNIQTFQEVFDYFIEQVQKIHPVGKRSVLIAHPFVSGGSESESERDLVVGGSGVVEARSLTFFDYVALGHLHQPQQFLEGKVRYAGSLLKYSFSEVKHTKGVLLVEMDAQGKLQTEPIALNPLRDVQLVEGVIENDTFRLHGEEAAIGQNDLLKVKLLNNQPVANAMAIVQRKYRYAAALEWNWQPPESYRWHKAQPQSVKKVDTIQLFESFFTEMQTQELTDQQKNILHKLIQDLATELL